MMDDLDTFLGGGAKPANDSSLDDFLGAKPAQKTQYGFDVRPTTIDLGRGPTETVQREDGAVWVDASKGWDPKWKGGEGWKFQSGGQYVPAPAKPASKMGWLERNVGPESWKSMGRNIDEGFASPARALAGLGADAANALGLTSDQSYMQGIQARDRQEDYRRAVNATSGAGSGMAQMVGEAVPMALAMAATRTALPAASGTGGAGLLSSASGNALATMPAAYALTPGDQSQRLKAANAAGLTSAAGETALGGLAKAFAARKAGKAVGIIDDATSPVAQADAVPGAAATPAVAQNTPEMSAMVGETAKKAAGTGHTAVAARRDLAEMAKVNLEAKAAADKLGINLPADVFSDSNLVKEAAGSTRSIFGSEPAAAWKDYVTEAAAKADDALRQLDATFVEGTASPGAVSQKARERLTGTIKELDGQASELYKAADEFLPLESKPVMRNLSAELEKISSELGGRMSAQERRLVDELSQGMTYGLMKREKDLIGAAIGRRPSPWADSQTGTLKRLYGAIAEDQMEHAATMGGDDLRSMMRTANQITSKKKALETRFSQAFGDVDTGSIARKMVSAITSGAKGATKDFEDLLKVVPKELHKETLATAIASATRSARAVDKGTFGFTEFAKTYRGIMANPQIRARIIETMGQEADDVLKALHTVSQRVSEAQSNVLTTGKANQALMSAMTAETLTERMMRSAVVQGAATVTDAIPGGRLVTGATSTLANVLTGGKKEPLKAIGAMFNSEDFKRLAVDAATKPSVPRMSVERLAASPKFNKYADTIGLPKKFSTRAAWINSMLASGNETEE